MGEVCEWYKEECKTEYVKHCENNKRAKRGVLQAILLTSAIASQNEATTEAPADNKVRCYNSPQPSPLRTRRRPRHLLITRSVATTLLQQRAGTTTTAPLTASAEPPTLGTATGRAGVLMPKTVLKCRQGIAT